MDSSAVSLRPPSRYLLPDALRDELKGEFGPIVQTEELAEALSGAPAIAAVGDMVSLTLKQLDITPRVFVCDFHTQRGEPSGRFRAELVDWGDHAIRVRNPAGELTATSWDACVDAVRRNGHSRIQVDGEEDLLALPLFLAMPLGSKVIYGVPNQGVGVVTVDDALQARVRGLVERMTPE